jgi:hypothetical protein
MAVADAGGKFALKELDANLLFRLLVVADGYIPTFSSKVIDPGAGVVEFKLKSHDLDRRDPERVLRGRVVNDTGQPIQGAMVQVSGFKRGTITHWGGLQGFDPLAVMNDRGEFRLGIAEKGDGVCLQASARGFASRCFAPLPAGSKSHDLELGPGVTITGQVFKDGKPLTGVALGLVEQTRDVSKFVGDFKISTDDRGHFVFLNVPPNETYALYGLMESLQSHGTIPVALSQVSNHGTAKDVGRLSVQPAYRLSGRVVLADGKPVPEGTRLLLGREQSWDTQSFILPEDGSFAFIGVPKERCSLVVNIPGYHPSTKNASSELPSGRRLVGRVEGDIDGLRFLMEPGPQPLTNSAKFTREDYEQAERRRNQPLQGAPP